jgi:hypothetical protein
MTRPISFILAGTLAGVLLAGCASHSVPPEDPALASCEAAARDAGLKPKGRHFLSIDARDQAPALWRRLASRAGRVFDQPAPNPLYRVNVDRCVKAAHPLAQH